MTSDMATAVGTDAAAGLTAPVTAALTGQYALLAAQLQVDENQLALGNIPGVPALSTAIAGAVTGISQIIGGVYGSATGNDAEGAASFWNAALSLIHI